MFELLLYADHMEASMEDQIHFTQWFECFLILFGPSPDSLMDEYKNLNSTVEVITGEDKVFEMHDCSNNTVSWVNGFVPRNQRADEILSDFFRSNIYQKALDRL